MSDEQSVQQCLMCHRDAEQTPLIAIEYRKSRLWICPQHLPVLIHEPAALIGTLPGAENLKPAEIHD